MPRKNAGRRAAKPAKSAISSSRRSCTALLSARPERAMQALRSAKVAADLHRSYPRTYGLDAAHVEKDRAGARMDVRSSALLDRDARSRFKRLARERAGARP